MVWVRYVSCKFEDAKQIFKLELYKSLQNQMKCLSFRSEATDLLITVTVQALAYICLADV